METEPTVKELPASEKPRERLQKHGVEALTDAELLAIIIRSGGIQRNVLELSRGILASLGLAGLRDASRNELMQFSGVGEVKAGQLQAVSELADRLQHSGHARPLQDSITDPDDAVDYLQEMRRFDEERVALICLSPDNTVVSAEMELLKGAVDEVGIPPRAIVREAVRQKAAGVVLGHNHPSGDPTPSTSDIDATDRVATALDTVGIHLLDHIIVGDDCCSLYREGYV
ncbi:MAG: DNA repair protein RadC [Candidatus Nanohaloarchaea archaeon]|nr:DNA repair protein RadC [Candidatus Nanohaloarchaea archaeon]